MSLPSNGLILKAERRKPSGEGSSVVFHARTLRKPMDMKTHRAVCATPLSSADDQEMQLHQCPDLKVLGASPPDQSGKGKVNGTIRCISRKLTTAPSVASASSNEISFGMVASAYVFCVTLHCSLKVANPWQSIYRNRQAAWNFSPAIRQNSTFSRP